MEVCMNLKDFLETLNESKGQQEIDLIMAKVRSGESLTDNEREKLSVAIDAAKEENDNKANNKLDKIMSKIAKGEKLTDDDKELLAIAIAARKK